MRWNRNNNKVAVREIKGVRKENNEEGRERRRGWSVLILTLAPNITFSIGFVEYMVAKETTVFVLGIGNAPWTAEIST